jgi:hypothetical protein
MAWTPLASSNLAACDYDEASRVLQIRFQSGRTYSYKDVPQETAEGLMQANSPGKYFNSNIRGIFSEA